MAGTITVDTIQSDSSYNSVVTIPSKVNFTGGMQIGGQDTTFGGMRNRIINGNFSVNQRVVFDTATTPSTSIYTADRWVHYESQASKLTLQRVTDAPNGFPYSFKFTTASTVTPGSTDFFSLEQLIESNYLIDLAWGTSSASPITVSFWVKSSLTGTFGGAVYNANGGTYGASFSYTINQANTWEYKTAVISGPTSGSWNTGTSSFLSLCFSVGMGSSYQSAPGTWTNSTPRTCTGATNVIATNGATWQITGVQLEKGSIATSYEVRPFTTEFQLCQRYYQKTYPYATKPGVASSCGRQYEGYSFTGNHVIPVSFPVQMRIAPSMHGYAEDGTYDYFTTSAGNATSNFFQISESGCSPYSYFNGGWFRYIYTADAEF